jgi:phosphatidate cytidylyltransferase
MLRHRLILGTLMAAGFGGLVLLDGWLDGSLTCPKGGSGHVQGVIFTVLVCLLMVVSHLELAAMAGAKGMRIASAVVIAGSILLCSAVYWPQYRGLGWAAYVVGILTATFFGLLLYQVSVHGLSGVIANTGAGLLATVYLGVLGAFAVLVRVHFGLWPLLMYVCVVKAADIGAFTAGSLFGKHKLVPKISPGKTWEGLAGGIVLAAIVAMPFGGACGILSMYWILAFGVIFAVIGQLGDLAESMLKRDAQVKDASDRVPGFGGVLDVLDSPLAAAPFAYAFFACLSTI